MSETQTARDLLSETELISLEDYRPLARLAFTEKDGVNRLDVKVERLKKDLAEGLSGEARERTALTCAIGLVVLGKLQEAIYLVEADERRGPRLSVWLARCHLLNGGAKEALAVLQEIEGGKREGLDEEMLLLRAEALTRTGDLDAAREVLAGVKEGEGKASCLFQEGYILEQAGRYDEALTLYEKALDKDPELAEASFRLGYVYDLRGIEDRALQYYLKCTSLPPVSTNALVNLGVLYEDLGKDEEALRCFRAVLKQNPNHGRARLYFKGLAKSLDIQVDEDVLKIEPPRNPVLDTPVTDFALSIRSRNCLVKMNIKTLGDLVKKTEDEFLATKNFGENSLNEIKDLLKSKGLTLGQSASQAAPPPPMELYRKGVAELNLSVRCRKALKALNIQTIGDLCGRTKMDLLGCDNFGQTSLEEIREKLASHSLKLRDDP